MPVLTLIGLTITAAILTVRLLGQTELWQRKEYRLDRLWSLLRTAERRTVLSWWQIVIGVGLVVVWVVWIIQDNTTLTTTGASLLLVAYAIGQVYQLRTRGLYRPQLTSKGILVLLGGLVCLIGLAGLLWQYVVALDALLAVTLIMLLPLPVAVAVGLVNIPTNWRKQQIINQATAKRRQLTQLKAVGITGSYGKTSTKFFTQQLLYDQPTTVFSKEHRNSVIVIAQDMLQQLKPSTHSYIAEMGAYRQGEIRELCQLVQPQIGVLTAIGNQHLALFGSQAAITTAKWELIDSLPDDGIAILNADDERIATKSQGLEHKTIWYSTKRRANVYVSHVQIAAESITCQLHIHDFVKTITIPLLSEALLSSAVAAAALATTLGLDPAAVAERLAQLKPYPRTMELVHNGQGTTVIDDSYSASEQSVLMAIQHLQRFSQTKKVIILTPVIELGEAGPSTHERIGQALANSNATVIITNRTYWDDLLRGARSVKPDFKLQTADTPAALAQLIQPLLQPDMVVLLKGRSPAIIRQTVLQ